MMKIKIKRLLHVFLLLGAVHAYALDYDQNPISTNQNTLFQVGTVASLLQGGYEGDIDFRTLALHGDTGLGTFNGVDGELVAIDGVFYRIDADGIAQEVSPDTCTPFAVVSHFNPTIQFTLYDVKDMDSLTQSIDRHLPTLNIFYMIRVEVELDHIHFRSESAQPKPYRPLHETFADVQREFELDHIHATLVGLRSPAYSSPLNSPGYHFHFIDQERTTGGHVFNVKIINATVSIQPLQQWNISLPQ